MLAVDNRGDKNTGQRRIQLKNLGGMILFLKNRLILISYIWMHHSRKHLGKHALFLEQLFCAREVRD